MLTRLPGSPKVRVQAFNYTKDWPEVPDAWYWEWNCPCCRDFRTIRPPGAAKLALKDALHHIYIRHPRGDV